MGQEDNNEIESVSDIFDELASRDEGGDDTSTEEQVSPSAEVQQAPSGDGTKDGDKATKTGTDEQQSAAAQQAAAPEWLTADEKTAYGNLTDDAKSLLNGVLDRRNREIEANSTRKLQEAAQQRNSAEPLLNVSTKHQSYFQQLGVKAEQAFDHLVTVERQLRHGTPEQKHQMFAQLARDYGVNLSATNQPGQPGTNENSPELARLYQEVTDLRQRLQQGESRAQEAAVSSKSREIAAFAAEKDEKGQPKYPYYEDVMDQMIQIAQARAVTNQPPMALGELYENAIWANPDVRAKLIEAQDASRRAASLEETKRVSTDAKRAADARVKSRTPQPPQLKKYDGPQAGMQQTSDIFDELARRG